MSELKRVRGVGSFEIRLLSQVLTLALHSHLTYSILPYTPYTLTFVDRFILNLILNLFLSYVRGGGVNVHSGGYARRDVYWTNERVKWYTH